MSNNNRGRKPALAGCQKSRPGLFWRLRACTWLPALLICAAAGSWGVSSVLAQDTPAQDVTAEDQPAAPQAESSANSNAAPKALDSRTKELDDQRAQLMYELMIAELAGRRGYMDVATERYLSAAKRSDDVRVADRATKMAVWSRQWDLARQAASRWLEIDPQSAEAREIFAQILMQSDQTEGAALDEFADLIESSDEPDVVLRDIYILLAREQDTPAALALLRGLQSRFPQNVEAHMGVARLLYQMNDRDATLKALDQALEIEPENGEALLTKAQILSDQGRPTEALDEIQNALKINPDNVELRIGYARLLANVGQYAQANEELAYLFETAGDDSDVLLSIGLLALDSKRTDEAQRYLEALRETGDHRNQAYYYLARIDDQKQAFDSAIQLYEQVGEGDLYLSAQLRSAELYAASGELEIGVERVRSLSSLLPDPAMQPMLITTESRMLQDADRDADAIKILSDGLEKFPDNGELLYARALASDRIGDNESLIADLNTLIVAEPDNANALNALGYFLAEDNQRLDEAQVYLEKAISLQPDDPAIMDSLGWLRFRQGDYEAAKALLEQAYELLPDAEIAAHLGEVLWMVGNKSEARSIWDKALLDAPDHVKLIDTMERLNP